MKDNSVRQEGPSKQGKENSQGDTGKTKRGVVLNLTLSTLIWYKVGLKKFMKGPLLWYNG